MTIVDWFSSICKEGFIFKRSLSFHSRPRWALVEKVHMHNTYRASQSSYHKFRANENLSPSNHMMYLMQDLLELSLHNYDGIR